MIPKPVERQVAAGTRTEPAAPTRVAPGFLAATIVLIFLAHATAYFTHEWSHATTAWLLGWDTGPFDIDHGHLVPSNILFQQKVDDGVNYAPEDEERGDGHDRQEQSGRDPEAVRDERHVGMCRDRAVRRVAPDVSRAHDGEPEDVEGEPAPGENRAGPKQERADNRDLVIASVEAGVAEEEEVDRAGEHRDGGVLGRAGGEQRLPDHGQHAGEQIARERLPSSGRAL